MILFAGHGDGTTLKVRRGAAAAFGEPVEDRLPDAGTRQTVGVKRTTRIERVDLDHGVTEDIEAGETDSRREEVRGERVADLAIGRGDVGGFGQPTLLEVVTELSGRAAAKVAADHGPV